jgi:carboxyl-terminal processing protease
MQHVEQSYVHALSEEDRRKFMDNAIQGGLQSLDMHSGYINPKEFKAFSRQSEGAFGGVGIQLSTNRDTKRLVVISPIVGTPAYKAGIKPGDEIEKIDGESTSGMTIEDAIDRIQGQPGTQVKLTVRPRGSNRTREVNLTRSLIEVESVLGDQRDANKSWDFMLDKKNRIGYVRLVQFNKKSYDELRAAVEKLQAEGARGFILDLRNNPGGLLDAAVNISDLFLPGGPVVSVEGRTRSKQVYEAHEAGTMLRNRPMVVLVNENSASASEIVAAALQDHKRAVVIGERSFGKGSVQNLIPMESGKSALKLTTAKYMRPSGKNIHRFPDSKEEEDWGVRPDIQVKLTLPEEIEYWTARRDRDIVREDKSPAELVEPLANVMGTIGTAWTLEPTLAPLVSAVELGAVTEPLPRAPRPFSDKVLDRALEYIREQLNGPAAASARPG